MITAVLAFIFVWSLSYGRVPQPWQLLFCIGLSIALALAGGHKHGGVISIDVYAQCSRLKNSNPTLKFWTLLALIIVCVASRTVHTGIFLMLVMLSLAVFAGGMKLHHYVQIIALPVSFLLIAGIALLVEVSPEPIGVINLPVLRSWLSITSSAQDRAALIVSRALGAVSCLTLLSVTTPMPDIIGVLRKARCPDLIIDLMYLIYRYIFILLNLHTHMRNAAGSRLGFIDYRTGMRTTGRIFANLLSRSYSFASRNFDAMESRCYDSGIRFMQRKHKLTSIEIIISTALLVIALFLSFIL